MTMTSFSMPLSIKAHTAYHWLGQQNGFYQLLRAIGTQTSFDLPRIVITAPVKLRRKRVGVVLYGSNLATFNRLGLEAVERILEAIYDGDETFTV
jgi:hypothetical protein